MSLTLKGVDVVLKNLRQIQTNVPDSAGAALFNRAEVIMTDSKQNYVPVDTGALRGSGHVQQPVKSGNEIAVTMGYGGVANAYAIPQHERLDYNHTVGGPKYLERPLLEHGKTLARDLANDLKGLK